MSQITQWIDHTLLKPETTYNEIRTLCEEAKQFGFFAVCVNPVFVDYAKRELEDSAVKVATVVGFPLGASRTLVKAFETQQAIAEGADEIDMVIQLGALKSSRWDWVRRDIEEVVSAAQNRPVKVIIETALLTRDEKIQACEVAVQAGAKFVKTSTGFSASGATEDDIRLMREVVGPEVGVKASGGLRTLEDIEKMIRAGASRIGTSSAAKILLNQTPTGNY